MGGPSGSSSAVQPVAVRLRRTSRPSESDGHDLQAAVRSAGRDHVRVALLRRDRSKGERSVAECPHGDPGRERGRDVLVRQARQLRCPCVHQVDSRRLADPVARHVCDGPSAARVVDRDLHGVLAVRAIALVDDGDPPTPDVDVDQVPDQHLAGRDAPPSTGVEHRAGDADLAVPVQRSSSVPRSTRGDQPRPSRFVVIRDPPTWVTRMRSAPASDPYHGTADASHASPSGVTASDGTLYSSIGPRREVCQPGPWSVA